MFFHQNFARKSIFLLPKFQKFRFRFLKDVYHHDLRHLRNTRYVNIKALLAQEAARIPEDARDSDTRLAQLRYTLFGTEYKLDRRDVVEVLPLIADRIQGKIVNSILAHNLVLGSWSADPPAYLR